MSVGGRKGIECLARLGGILSPALFGSLSARVERMCRGFRYRRCRTSGDEELGDVRMRCALWRA